MEKNNFIFVLYIGVAGIRTEDIPQYVKKVSQIVIPKSVKGEFITLPTQSYENKLVCINPEYITEKTLIKEHESLMSELNDNLKKQISLLENEEN
jgi:hypothetical protein